MKKGTLWKNQSTGECAQIVRVYNKRNKHWLPWVEYVVVSPTLEARPRKMPAWEFRNKWTNIDKKNHVKVVSR